MHDFEDRIGAWRKQALTALGGDVDAVAELESHLRQSLEERADMPADEAWAAAVSRLGDLEKLKHEFAKAQPAGTADAVLMWLVVAACLLVMLGSFFSVLARREQGKDGDVLLMVHVGCVLVGYISSIAAGILGSYFGLRLTLGDSINRTLTRSMPNIAANLCGLALVMTTLAVVLGMVWAHRHSGRAWSGDGKEIGGLSVILLHAALMAGLASGKLSRRALLALNGLAAPVTIGAWFVLILFGRLHALVGAWALLSLACITIAALAWRRVRREDVLLESD